jgi:uncharacterized protein YlaN (UPF0358 family)
MQITVKNKDIFPGEARELLQALYSVGFFEESMLIGSWVMPLYQDAFDISYALRTQDIDFAVKFVLVDRREKAASDIDLMIIGEPNTSRLNEKIIELENILKTGFAEKTKDNADRKRE